MWRCIFILAARIILWVYTNTMVATRGQRGKKAATPSPKPALKKRTTKASARFVVPPSALKPWGSMAGRSATPAQVRKHASDLRALRAEHEKEVAALKKGLDALRKEVSKANRGRSADVRLAGPRDAVAPRGWFEKVIGGVKYFIREVSRSGKFVAFVSGVVVGAGATWWLTSGPPTVDVARRILEKSGQANSLGHLGTLAYDVPAPGGEHRSITLSNHIKQLRAQGIAV